VDLARQLSEFSLPGMDCPAEEQLVRLALARADGIHDLQFSLPDRELRILHDGAAGPILDALRPLGLGARLLSTGPATTGAEATRVRGQRGVLWIVLTLNAAMFVVELIAGVWAQSTGLIADSLDMLADAAVYGIALAAVGGSALSQRRSARTSGWLQLALAVIVLADAGRRLVVGSEPVSAAMMTVGALALAVNVTVVALIARHRGGGVHLRASWIFSVNDTLANLGVIAAGVLVAVTGSQLPDLIAGTAIAILVASGAWRILRI
jgi:Co/Zn/Cd efflux system component